ncbi:MAG: hypothetical protein IJE18_06230 [Bacteroidaceae bacterium]|nr:hypothetical protein [Bacteroidaceae bacterium]
MQGIKFNPTPEQLQYLIDNFHNTRNADLALHLGIGMRTVNRLASIHGLTKSQEFLSARQQKAGEFLRKWNTLNPKPVGYRIPRSEENYFKSGTSIRSRQGEEAQQQAIAKATRTRRETIKKERRRILFGLPQRTALKLIAKPREKVQLRYYLRKRGYIIDDANHLAYYTEHTLRGSRIERKEQPWYSFAPLPPQQKTPPAHLE